MDTSPIQVVLNPDNFRRDRVSPTPVNNGTDFFLGHDEEFAAHRNALITQLAGIEKQLSSPQRVTAFGVGDFVRVVMRPQALAKGHRPIFKLFKPNVAPVVGGEQLGEVLCFVTPEALDQVSKSVERAEIEGRTRVDKKTGETVPAPSRYRCEVSAIEKIELWGKPKRRRFDLEQAIKWLAQPGTGHGYIVSIFLLPPPHTQWDTLPEAESELFNSFFNGLRNLGLGLRSRRVASSSKSSLELQIRVVSNLKGESGPEEFIDDIEIHRALLGFLETHPLVREIRLPSIILQSQPEGQATSGSQSSQTDRITPVNGQSYPKIGVIDGGIAAQLSPWVKYTAGVLDASHASLDHGSFIAGLLVEGAQRNPHLSLELDGCELADINVFPNTKIPGVFDLYYPNGSSDFFDEIDGAIEQCREQHGIRVFNLSINAVMPTQLDQYSLEARRLDEIAERHDVLIVVSAGNLKEAQMRPEWPANDTAAAAILAATRDDGLFVPAETVRNLSVSSVNPFGMSSCIGDVPARYTRRGPGLRTGLKPDLCHFGGSGSFCASTEFGLHSLAPNGAAVSGCGTSYAAPLVAKTLAALEHSIEGEVSRETLTALVVHSAVMPKALTRKAFKGVAPQLVGFGRPKSAVEALSGSPHEITLLFSSRITYRKMLEFRFSWPASLVTAEGKCSGDVQMTLVASPPLDYRFGSEFIRINIDAALQQEKEDGKFAKALEPTHVFFGSDGARNEKDLIEHQLKWAPTKSFSARMKGRGKSSNWRLVVNYLERAGMMMPEEGVAFSVLLTIRDPSGEKPVFNEMRQVLESTGIKTADIRTATRVSTRV